MNNKKTKTTKKNIIKKKVKINYKRIFLFILFLFLIIIINIYIIKLPLKNIYVSGCFNVSEQTIIELANIQEYPPFLFLNKNKMERKIKANPFVKKVNVEKKFFGKVEIKIEENRILFVDDFNKKLILENNKKVEIENFSNDVPLLVNNVFNKKYNIFINKMSLLNDEILFKISEIKYIPNSIDDELFLLTMNDGNYIYATLRTFERINKYIEIYPTLENKKGILYLDSGKYFEIKEW